MIENTHYLVHSRLKPKCTTNAKLQAFSPFLKTSMLVHSHCRILLAAYYVKFTFLFKVCFSNVLNAKPNSWCHVDVWSSHCRQTFQCLPIFICHFKFVPGKACLSKQNNLNKLFKWSVTRCILARSWKLMFNYFVRWSLPS